jgi:hypothetical protein
MLWSIAHNLVKRYGPWRRIIEESAEAVECHLNAFYILNRKKAKNCIGINFATPRPMQHMLDIPLSFEKSDSVLWATVQNKF